MPGEVVVIEKGRITDRRTYWSPLRIEPRTIEYAEAEAEFDEIMDTVMTEHMRSDVPFGLFLSGGVDSAILLALLSRLKDEPVRTFSVGFPGTGLADELPAARAMARQFVSRHEEITPDVQDVYGVIPLTVWAADDLMRDYANLPTCLLAASAARELKVVFSGEGGDEVFAGYGRYRAPWLERFTKSLLAPGTGGFRSRGTFRGRWPEKLFGTQLRQAIRDHLTPFIDARGRTPDTWSDLMRMQYTDLVTAIPDNLLVKTDRMTMAWGLEGRVPFLDHRIVEFGLSLPSNLKIQSGEGKVFLKRWASRYIPEDYLRKPKKGFHVPMGEWLSRPFIEELQKILPAHPSIKPWFKPAGILELIKRSPDSPVNTRMLWAILQFAIWYKLFIENSGERPETFKDPIEFLR
jgi:asparagine synthase (glutamine-hydrolysing)